MALVVPNGAESDALSYFLNISSPQDLVLRLFTNNVTPGETDVAASYSEAAGFGYAAIALVAANWVIVQDAPTVATYPAQTVTFSGALGSVYGYFVTRSGNGRLAWAERFSSAPFTIANAGDQITITPVLTLE